MTTPAHGTMSQPGAMAHIHQINVSDGGVPKVPVDRAAVALDGMEGDRQADRKHHDGPDQTLCLYPMKVIGGCDHGRPCGSDHFLRNSTVRFQASSKESGSKLAPSGSANPCSVPG